MKGWLTRLESTQRSYQHDTAPGWSRGQRASCPQVSRVSALKESWFTQKCWRWKNSWLKSNLILYFYLLFVLCSFALFVFNIINNLGLLVKNFVSQSLKTVLAIHVRSLKTDPAPEGSSMTFKSITFPSVLVGFPMLSDTKKQSNDSVSRFWLNNGWNEDHIFILRKGLSDTLFPWVQGGATAHAGLLDRHTSPAQRSSSHFCSSWETAVCVRE